MKLNYIPVLNVLLITDSLSLHKICIFKKISSKGNSNVMTIRLNCTDIEIYRLIHTNTHIVMQC